MSPENCKAGALPAELHPRRKCVLTCADTLCPPRGKSSTGVLYAWLEDESIPMVSRFEAAAERHGVEQQMLDLLGMRSQDC
jgi:hypothetical protein